MNADKIDQLEILLARKLSEEEIARLRRIKNVLEIPEDDALWDILAAMEYQRAYYEELPQKIAAASAEILQKISVAAEKEVAAAQSRLADSVLEQAKKLSLRVHARFWLMWGMLTLILLLLHGSLLLWAGYCIGSGQTQPPALLLRMPVGGIIGALCFCGGIFGGALAAKNFSEGHTAWRKLLLAALGCLVAGGWIFCIAAG